MNDKKDYRNGSKANHVATELDLQQIAGILWQRRLWIGVITLLVVVSAGLYSFVKWPSYQTEAMLQIDSGRDVYSLISDLPFGNEGVPGEKNQANIDILKSRTVLGKAAKELDLDIEVLPNYFPLLSGWCIKRQNSGQSEQFDAPAWLPSGYAWIGESVNVQQLIVPPEYIDQQLILSAEEAGQYALYDDDNNLILRGVIGENAVKGGFSILVSDISARAGVKFNLRKLNMQDVITSLQQSIHIKGGKHKTDRVIKVMYQHYNAKHASILLNTVIKDYVQHNIFSQTEATEKTLQFIESQLAKYSKDLSFNNKLYMMLLTKAHELKVLKAGELGDVHVVDNAYIPLRPAGIGAIGIIAIAALLGLMLGIITAIIRQFLDHALYHPDEIEGSLNLHVYATIPLSSAQVALNKEGWALSGNGNLKQPILFSEHPDDPALEAMRFLRTLIDDENLRSGYHRVIAITGPSPNVGKTFLSTNLACLMSELGLKILLIDADLRRGVLHEYFALEKECGLAEFLTESVSFDSVAKYSGINNVDVITRGGTPDNPSVLMSSSKLQELLKLGKEKYDLVLIDTPPALSVTDAAIISRYVDQLLIVIRAAQTTLDEVSATWKRLSQSEKMPIGFVMSGYDPGKFGYGKYHQYGYY